jgi:hypothetical protein
MVQSDLLAIRHWKKYMRRMRDYCAAKHLSETSYAAEVGVRGTRRRRRQRDSDAICIGTQTWPPWRQWTPPGCWRSAAGDAPRAWLVFFFFFLRRTRMIRWLLPGECGPGQIHDCCCKTEYRPISGPKSNKLSNARNPSNNTNCETAREHWLNTGPFQVRNPTNHQPSADPFKTWQC